MVLIRFVTYNPDINPKKAMRLVKRGYRESYLINVKDRFRLRDALDDSFCLLMNPSAFPAEYELVYHRRRGGTGYLFIHRSARIGWDERGSTFYLSCCLCRLLDNGIINLENSISERYGELVPWDEVREIFRMYDKAMIIDVETRMSFWVQRRAGSNHADVQPLTAEDSRTMRSIYGGKWSWKRRAVIVAVRGRRFAASMNGMPHGGGAIKDNEFPGHFCLHFLGSKTHTGNRPDPSHQAMVLKAAGKTEVPTD